MNLDDVIGDLVLGPLETFTQRRNQRARALKAAGQPDLADAVNRLKKPPVILWAVNRLARQDRAGLKRLREAGAAVVAAQTAAVRGERDAAAGLRGASDRLQTALAAGVQKVVTALREDRHAADEASLRRIQEILRVAAVSGGETFDRLVRGVLIEEPRADADVLGAALTLAGTPPTGTDRRAERAVERELAETERRAELDHARRTARMDRDQAEQLAETARRLREQATEMAGEAKKASDRAVEAERALAGATAKAKASEAAAARLEAHKER